MKAPTDLHLPTLRSLTHAAVALALGVAPLPVMAAEPAEAEAAPAEGTGQILGGHVALLRFDGKTAWGRQLRSDLVESLQSVGFTTKGVNVALSKAAAKNKCEPTEADCLERIGKYLNKNAKTPFDYYLYAVIAGPGQPSTVAIYDIARAKPFLDVQVNYVDDDLILPIVLPGALAETAAGIQRPTPPLSDEEKQEMATLDEPEKTPEEFAEEERILAAAKKAQQVQRAADPEAAAQEIDLKGGFKDLCREGPREDREEEQADGTKAKVRDLRPACGKGPFWGYWQPRAWVAASLAGVGALTAVGAYAMTMVARSEWKTAKSDLENAGVDPHDPDGRCNDSGQCYEDLAGQVSGASEVVRKRALMGDVALGATLLLSGVLVVIIGQDRTAARRYLATERELNVSSLRVVPMIGGGDSGTAVGAMTTFRF
ncbi:MAG: hypothetical protein V3V08_24975 [Nannocystaceae bacterium]